MMRMPQIVADAVVGNASGSTPSGGHVCTPGACLECAVPSDALVIAPAILAVVLIVSGVGKLRSPAASAQAFMALKVARRLSSPVVVRSLPWVEIVLGVALVVVGGGAGVVVSIAVLALFCAYLTLVVRARGFDTDVDCACFGSMGPGRVTTWTVWRNSWLVALAVLAVVVAATGDALLERLVDGTAPWQWLLAAAAAALTAVLVVGTGFDKASASAEQAPTATIGDVAVEEGDYLRTRTPALPLVLGDGSTTTLREISSSTPVLVLHVSEGCGGCVHVIDQIPAYRSRLPQVELRVLVATAPADSALTSAEAPQSLHDEHSYVSRTFGYGSIPSAFLLGADGLVAGGPVSGAAAISDFIDDIEAELHEALLVGSPSVDADESR
jgi:hypothetical protein